MSWKERLQENPLALSLQTQEKIDRALQQRSSSDSKSVFTAVVSIVDPEASTEWIDSVSQNYEINPYVIPELLDLNIITKQTLRLKTTSLSRRNNLSDLEKIWINFVKQL